MTNHPNKPSVSENLLSCSGGNKILRIEMPGIKLHVSFMTAEAHRMFLRMFESFQICAHFVGVTAKERIADDEDQALVDAHYLAMREAVDAARAKLNETLDKAEVLFKANGIAPPYIFETEPLRMSVNVNSAVERRFLELICQLDHVIVVLEALEIRQVSAVDALVMQRAKLKRAVKDVLKTTRRLSTELRQTMTIKWARAQDFDRSPASLRRRPGQPSTLRDRPR